MRDHDRLIALEERVKGDRHALVLQRKEYQRRLGELNHAHEQAVEKDAEFLRASVFDSYTKEQVLREERAAGALRLEVKATTRTQEARLTALETYKNRAMGAAVILTLASAAVGAAVIKVLGG